MFRTTSCVSNVKTLLVSIIVVIYSIVMISGVQQAGSYKGNDSGLTVVYCRRPRDYQLAPIARVPPNYAPYDPRPRKPCPVQPPPPLPQTRDDRWIWGGLAVLLIAGFGIVCAHDSPEIRDWLTLYAPWMDDFIAILYQENITYGELAVQCMIDIKNRIDKLYTGSEKQCYPDGKSIADVSRNARMSPTDDNKNASATR